MAHPQALTLRPIASAEAAARLRGIEEFDPGGTCSGLDELASSGQAFAVEGAAVDAVFVVQVRNGTAFVMAAKGGGAIDVTALLDELVTRAATNDGLSAIALQTTRPGLVHKLKKRGFHVAGWVMRKNLTQ